MIVWLFRHRLLPPASLGKRGREIMLKVAYRDFSKLARFKIPGIRFEHFYGDVCGYVCVYVFFVYVYMYGSRKRWTNLLKNYASENYENIQITLLYFEVYRQTGNGTLFETLNSFSYKLCLKNIFTRFMTL